MPVVWNNDPHNVKFFGGGNAKKGGGGEKKGTTKWGMFGPGIPKFPTPMLLHGEQYVEILSPLPLKGEFTTETKNVSVQDKGKGCVLENQTIFKDTSGKEICKTAASMFIRGMGGFEGAGEPFFQPAPPPNRSPDKSVELFVPEKQAMLYRLSGDYNPLHADPEVATSVGFPGPILHGLSIQFFPS
eukprot:g2418.t1